MAFSQMIRAILVWTPVVVLLAVLGAAAGYAVSSTLPKRYEAEATLLVGRALNASEPDYNTLLASQLVAQTYAEIATTRPLLAAVITRLGLVTTVADLEKRVAAEAHRSSTILEVRAQDADAEVSARIANAIAEQLIKMASATPDAEAAEGRAIDAELGSLAREIRIVTAARDALAIIASPTAPQQEERRRLDARLDGLRATRATLLAAPRPTGGPGLSLVDAAVRPIEPASPRTVLNAGIGALLGAMLAFVLAFLSAAIGSEGRAARSVAVQLRTAAQRSWSRDRARPEDPRWRPGRVTVEETPPDR